MRRRRLAAVAALACAPLVVPSTVVRAATPARISGVSLATNNNPIAVSQLDISRIADTGVNHLGLDATLVVSSPSSNTLTARPLTTPTDSDLVQAMSNARAEGLRTTFTPKFRVEGASNPENTAWRGYYLPTDLDAFWADYRTKILHYAELAAANGVDVFFVGSEMNRLEQFTDRWRALIADVRKVYHGKVSYEMNWDVFLGRSPTPRVAFWDALDYIGLSAYFPISDAERPSLEQLKAGWTNSGGRNWVAAIAALSAKWKKPVLFGEAGYLASTYVGKKPYDENVVTADNALQARAYLALLETFDPQPWWAGVIWWDWDRRFPSRSIHDKPAEELLRQWYRDGLRPGMTGFDGERAPGLLAPVTYSVRLPSVATSAAARPEPVVPIPSSPTGNAVAPPATVAGAAALGGPASWSSGAHPSPTTTVAMSSRLAAYAHAGPAGDDDGGTRTPAVAVVVCTLAAVVVCTLAAGVLSLFAGMRRRDHQSLRTRT